MQQSHTKLLISPLKISPYSNWNNNPLPKKKSFSTGPLIELRVSYFYPSSSKVREVFHDGGVNYQITGAFPVYYGQNLWIKGINIWTAVDYFYKEGRTKELLTKTTGKYGELPPSRCGLRIIPITLGVKYFFPSLGVVAPVNFYIGSGMKYFFVHNHTESDYIKRTINANGLGGVVETGFTTTVMKHLTFDVYASYSFKTFGSPSLSKYPPAQPIRMNISGANVGVGLGYKF